MGRLNEVLKGGDRIGKRTIEGGIVGAGANILTVLSTKIVGHEKGLVSDITIPWLVTGVVLGASYGIGEVVGNVKGPSKNMLKTFATSAATAFAGVDILVGGLTLKSELAGLHSEPLATAFALGVLGTLGGIASLSYALGRTRQQRKENTDLTTII